MNREHPFDKLELISYVTGDISTEKAVLLKDHLECCETCRFFVEELTTEKDDFLIEHPFDEGFMDQISSEFEEEGHTKRPVFFTFPRIASIAALLLFATILTLNLRQSKSTLPSDMGIGLKGEENFYLYVLNVNGEIGQRDDEVYYPHERVHVCYTSSQKEYLMLFSIDTAGTISRFFPAHRDSSISVDIGSGIPLPNSIRLDGYIGKERYLMVLSKKAVSASDFENEIRKEFEKHGFDAFRLPNKAGRTVLEKLTTKRGINEK